MDAIKFIKEYNRMCDLYVGANCQNCPALKLQVESGRSDCCWDIAGDLPEYYVPVVEKWSAEHPQKTRMQDFIGKYPNATLISEDMPQTCCMHLGYCDEVECLTYSGCAECWNQPLEDNE